jgi:hypothetical protein
MWYTFNCLVGIALGQILPHVWKDEMIGLEALSAFIQLLKAAVGDPDWVATTNRKMSKMKQINIYFFRYYVQFHVINPDDDCNLSAMHNARGKRLSKAMNNSFTYSDMPGKVHLFVTVCQKWDN